MARRGRSLSEHEVERIVHLLASTEISLGDIAKRMGCSRSVVVTINRKYKVRHYAGMRSEWTVLKPRH